MICKYCEYEMEFDSTEGMEYGEVHVYNCTGCDAVLLVHENGEEDRWEIPTQIILN